MNIHEIERTAETRIRQHRTADFHLRLRTAAGDPLPGARVTARLLRHDFRLGANGFLLRGGGAGGFQNRRLPDEALICAYEHAFSGLLNYATLPFYWSGYEKEPGREREEQLRVMADWCKEHGVIAKGHPLAWHETFPAWAEALPDGEVIDRLRARISRIVAAFRCAVDVWDVFNETTVAAHVENAVGRWVRARSAAECVAEALRLARAANPAAELLYNDFNISPAFEELVDQLRACGTAWDAVGIQSHMHKGAWSAEKTWQTCETYARFGLPLHFTETTILSGHLKTEADNDWHRRHTDWASTPEGEARQLEEGRRFYTLLFSHPAVDAVTWWDFSDRQAWQGAPAGLLRNDMSRKPLAEWLGHAFGEQWTTRATMRADAESMAAFRGFFGTYAVAVETASGACLAGTCRLGRRQSREAEVLLT